MSCHSLKNSKTPMSAKYVAITKSKHEADHHENKTPPHPRLRAALDTWITETGDQGAFPEPPGTVAPFEKEMHDWFGTPAWHPYPSVNR